MKRLLALMMCAVSLGVTAQVTYPYNPDGNADTLIGVTDLQDILSTYGQPFLPSEVLVGDSTLSFWVDQLSATVLTQQATIDSLLALQMAPVNNQFTFFDSYPFEITNGFTTGTGLFGLSESNQTSKELVTGFRLHNRECATIGKILHAVEVVYGGETENFYNMAVLVERVGVPDDYALYRIDTIIQSFNSGSETKVIVTFLAGSSSDLTPGAEYQISISALPYSD